MSITIGLLGSGVVGTGVVSLIEKKFQQKIIVKKVFTRNEAKTRASFADAGVSGESIQYVSDVDDILGDEEIQVVVEVMGDLALAERVIFGAIQKKKHVVTANKVFVSKNIDNLRAALAQQPSVRFGFEAAVCGGIPIIQAIQTSFSSDSVLSLKGIMNGTTNFMLSALESDPSLSYASILAEAQRLGYAEADPTADVEGYDVQAKIFILTYLALGFKLASPSDILTWGISSVDSKDFGIASKFFQSSIRLLAYSSLQEQNGGILVAPFLVSKTSSPFANVTGAGNMVQVQSENLGSSSFSGPGAGRFPTAHSVLNDLSRLLQDRASLNPLQRGIDEDPQAQKEVQIVTGSLKFNYLVRFVQEDQAAADEIKNYLASSGLSASLVTTEEGKYYYYKIEGASLEAVSTLLTWLRGKSSSAIFYILDC